MIYVAFAFNFNIQRCEIEVGAEEPIVSQGYAPLIRKFLDYGFKADLFLSGFSTRRLLEIDPGLVDTIREHLGSNFGLGTYTYTHPIPQLLLPREMEKQIQAGLQIDREVYKQQPQGFLPPELAYSEEMIRVLTKEGIQWTIVLAGLLRKALQIAGFDEKELYFPYTAASEDSSITVVPALYQLPDTPARFLKLMMKGELPVQAVHEGIRKFAEACPGGLLLFKRDAETIFIDRFNSGFEGTDEVMDQFLRGLKGIPGVEPILIGDFIDLHPPTGRVQLDEHLGNTRLATFTEGEAQSIWELTLEVREKLIAAEAAAPDSAAVRKAWQHLLLSHNSDGRIGYWFSEWNPGEHKVAPSRRKYVEDNLRQALQALTGV